MNDAAVLYAVADAPADAPAEIDATGNVFDDRRGQLHLVRRPLHRITVDPVSGAYSAVRVS